MQFDCSGVHVVNEDRYFLFYFENVRFEIIVASKWWCPVWGHFERVHWSVSYAGRIFRIKNSLFRWRMVCSLMSWQCRTRSSLLVGQKDIPFSSRLDCVAVNFMLDRLDTVYLLVCFLKYMEGWWFVKKSGMISWSWSEECKGEFRISCWSFSPL